MTIPELIKQLEQLPPGCTAGEWKITPATTKTRRTVETAVSVFICSIAMMGIDRFGWDLVGAFVIGLVVMRWIWTAWEDHQ